MSKVILQGGGEHARVVLDCLLSQNIDVEGLFDPKYDGYLFGVPQRGQYDSTFEPDAVAIVAIGDNAVRKKVVLNTKHHFGNAIHQSAIVSTRAALGVGNMILHGAVVQAQAFIANHCIINTRAQVDHDCILGDYVHVGPGAILCGTVELGEGAFIGAGATILPGVKVGAWATIGAGAVVRVDVPAYSVAVGNPAKVIKFKTP